MNIDTVITGDISEVGGAPNWIRERSRPAGMKVLSRCGDVTGSHCSDNCWPRGSRWFFRA